MHVFVWSSFSSFDLITSMQVQRQRRALDEDVRLKKPYCADLEANGTVQIDEDVWAAFEKVESGLSDSARVEVNRRRTLSQGLQRVLEQSTDCHRTYMGHAND